MTALRCIAFTDKGFALARRLAAALDGTAVRCGGDITLAGWTAEGFAQAKALVFVGAAGIAVRACAPYLKSKDKDPAVVAVDECARFVVPLVSGHLGGANDLARQIAALCGAQAVITTATDANGVFAVDSWAVRQGCTVSPVKSIKTVSAKLLAGEPIRLRSDWPITGTPPAGVLPVEVGPCDVHLTLAAPAEGDNGPLRVIPKILLAGIGCRKGTPMADIEAAVLSALEKAGADPLAVRGVTSIDCKGQEPGLVELCRVHGWDFTTFSPEVLAAQQGNFSDSEFVRKTVGTGNVCERSAVAAGGTLILQKQVGKGVTVALARLPFSPDWRWQYE